MEKIYFDGTPDTNHLTVRQYLDSLDVMAEVSDMGRMYKVIVNPNIGTSMFLAKAGEQLAMLQRISHKTEIKGAYTIYYVKKDVQIS